MTGNKRNNQTSPVGSPTSGNISDKEQDRFLPIANVSRIMKRALPANAKISKEAKETVQECVSEFISFITGEASDKCQREKRKTINGDDLLWAMTTLGFENYVGPLKVYLNNYRETEGEKSTTSVVTRQEDQISPTAIEVANDVVAAHSYSVVPKLAGKEDFGGFNGGFYSVVNSSPQVMSAAPKIFNHEIGGGINGYRESSIMNRGNNIAQVNGGSDADHAREILSCSWNKRNLLL